MVVPPTAAKPRKRGTTAVGSRPYAVASFRRCHPPQRFGSIPLQTLLLLATHVVFIGTALLRFYLYECVGVSVVQGAPRRRSL